MNVLLDSKYRVAFVAAAGLILLSAAAIIFASRQTKGPILPPIKAVEIKPGFVGAQTFGLWALVCENPKRPPAPADGSAPPTVPNRLCRANARMMVRVPNAQAPLLAAAFNIVMADTQSAVGLLFRLPPAASAANSVNFFIDKNTVFQAPLRCSKTQCFAQGALPPDALEQMRTGEKLSLVYTVKDKTQKDRKVRVDQLLHGFRQAYDGMLKAMAR